MSKNKKKVPQNSVPNEEEKRASETAVREDEKIDVTKSVFQVNREMQQQRQKELEEKQAELLRQHELKEKQKREAYDRRILEEKKELIRLKQGLIEESEVVKPEEQSEEKRSVWKRISSFFYLNKWWLGIGVICLFIAGVVVYSLVTRKTPDSVVMFVEYNVDVGEAEGLGDYLSQFVEDNNGDGKNEVTVYYIPFSDNEYSNYQLGVDAKISSQFQAADAVIVIGGENLSKFLEPVKESLADLTTMFPDDPHIADGCKFMLKGTKFAEKIGVDPQYITDDLYIAIRKPRKLPSASEEQMQKTYDRDIEMFKAILNDIR